MANNIFASHKQHSLFPITGCTPRITKDDYRLFYQEERALFTFLFTILQKEVVESTLVVGFLIWLEREGYTSYNLVQKIVNRLTVEVITHAIDHIVICLNLMQKRAYKNLISTGSCDISLLQSFLDRKTIYLEELYHNGDMVFQEVFCIGKEVYVKAFDDIILEQSSVIRHHGKPMMMNVHFPRDATVRCVVGDARFMSNCVMAAQEYQEMVALGSGTIIDPRLPTQHLRQKNLAYDHGSHALSMVRDPDQAHEDVSPENRTIFLTFSKGYPIPESEVKEYFTRIFGDFIVSIHMQSVVEPDDQPLYARIVARSASMVRAVVERDGPQGKSKYTINGKHVWARKFVPRISSRESAHINYS